MTWQAENRRFLSAHLARVRAALEAHAAESAPPAAPAAPEWPGDLGEPAALTTLSTAFGLTPFERDVLVLCTAMELDASFPALCARACGDLHRPHPTWSLAFAALSGAHWDALAPSAALRGNNLVEVEPGPSLTLSRIWAPERVWQFLLGIETIDRRLARYLQPLPEGGPPAPSHQRLAGEVAAACAAADCAGPVPVVQLSGRSSAD